MLKSVTQCRHLSSRTTITYNYHLRKRRKLLNSIHKSRWEQTLNQEAAMRYLKQQSTKTSPTHLLSALIDSFKIFNCDPTPSAYHFLIKTLTQTSQSHQLTPLLNHLQYVENFQTPEYIFVYLIEFYGHNNMIQQAIDLFFRIPSFRCTPSVVSLNSLLSVLTKNREGLRIVHQILLKSQLMSIRIEGSSYCILIRALCRIRKVGYAIKLLNCMIIDGYSIEAVSMCSLTLSALCEQRDVYSGVEIMGFLEETKKLGFCPNGADWCNVVRFLVKKGKGMDALDALNRMKTDGIKPDIVCYTMVLDGVIEEGKYTDVDELFDEMLVLGLVPDIYTYNVYISGLCKQNKVEEGIKMLDFMEELGCKPNMITYNILLEGFCKVGELAKAKKLVREMELKGMQQNAWTCGIMIRGLVRIGEFDEACSWLRKMLEECCIPHSSTIDEIVCGLCQRGLVCNAMELLEEMVGKDVAPGIRAWEALILGFGYNPSFEETAFMDLMSPIGTESVELVEHNFDHRFQAKL
ncbi:pentatricopeptide repeat-containing protein At2g38420, mitochondrial [Cornus florida]|uniref:pentatricopeptide repeat-containing protein At2g38420, mitochondrial n=1 Tax=Cornus florida TaxID=4283 RepID=UPI0028A0D25F|nr:pentatricopeptide repeat-containing protein At2g38420, mitochondrial [Cornus florida]XP_059642832.1 pentatricopeptide repeat-containing protein At2g38420, mitochondrial [Cornus florida]XP_059642833.1 pentatricopeptide repeat-containing protein At2g38420, mitochondrial [Cornus florida]